MRTIRGYGKLQRELETAYGRIKELELARDGYMRESMNATDLARAAHQGMKSAQGERDDLKRGVEVLGKQLGEAKQGPRQLRTVRRTVIFTGEAVAVAKQLAQSLPLGSRSYGLNEVTITVLAGEDFTSDVVQRG